MPFKRFENYLATSVLSGLEIGNINHTYHFIEKFLELVDKELIKMTATWFCEQKHVTITLDVGTENGIPLLAVLFISDNKAKLADIIPLISKTGLDLASTCFQACTLQGSIDKSQLETKIVGVTGDGVFAKGNAPFKNKMKELFNDKLVFRWDPLHLINRAHKDAKGKVTGVESADDELSEYGDESDEEKEEKNENNTLITELIDYIQKEAKKLRHGIAPTGVFFRCREYKLPTVAILSVI